MKKFVKPLVIAASVAAVAGIGAVSFAKWQSGTTNGDVTGSTGSVNTITLGTLNVNDAVTATQAFTGLLPWDQNVSGGNATPQTSDNTAVKVSVPVTLTNGAKYSLKVEAAAGDTDGITFDTDTKLYASTEAPASMTALDTTKWFDVSASGGHTFGDTGLTADSTVYLILVSNDTGDMGKNIKVTFTIAAVV